MNNQLKVAESNRQQDEKKFQEEKQRLQSQMQDIQNQSQRRGGGFLTDLVKTVFPIAAPVIDILDGLNSAPPIRRK